MKYLVETLSTFRNVYVVEADTEEQAFEMTKHIDDNWQEWLGYQKLDIRPYTEEQKNYFNNKDNYFWEGYTSLDAEGNIIYNYPNGETKIVSTSMR